jgi:mannose-6-phosphate isomerase-like protein (cupin superfamily)
MMERPTGSSVVRIAREEYEPFAALQHLFVVGDLQNPNPHPFVRDSRLELILCYYQPGDDGRRHWHRDVTEYEVVLEGEVGHFDIATGETVWFGAGDVRILPPGVCVERRIRTAARTVAIKVPSTAEKVHCAECPRECGSRIAPYLEEACVSR